MKKIAYYLVVYFTLNLLYGCMSMQSKSYVILNPDMSGKCTYEIKMGRDLAAIMTMPKEDMYSGFGLSGGMTKKSIPDPAMALANKLLSSGTIDAWKDVQFGYLKKDTVFFKGTAYFKDITKIAVSMFDSTLRAYKDDKGNNVLEISDMMNKKDTGYHTQSYDSITKNVFKNMGMSDIMHYYMASLVKGLDISVTYLLPGKIVSCSNFVRKSDNAVAISITGNDVIRLMDTLTNRDDLTGEMYNRYYSSMGLKSSITSGAEDSNKTYFYNKLLYGEDKPVKVVFKSEAKMAFDYQKEVAEAKKYYAEFRKTSGIDRYDSLAAAEKRQEEEEKTREQGTLVLTAADSAKHKTYFKKLTVEQYYGDMTFTGTLSKGIANAYSAKVKITRAYTDKGVNVTDSINKHSSYYGYDTAEDAYITAYLSPTTYAKSGSSWGTDSLMLSDKVTFSIYASFPEDTKFIDLQGNLILDSASPVPFKIINLYIKSKDDYSKGWK